MRHHIVSTDAGFKILDAELNIYVGNGKGDTLTLSDQDTAHFVVIELTARIALVSAEVDPNTGGPKDSDNDGGYDQDDYQDVPAFLSATSVTMRSLFG